MGHDGHIVSRIDIVCRNETDAKQRAKALVELWHGDRVIAKFRHEE
jgi:hypothetical protein